MWYQLTRIPNLLTVIAVFVSLGIFWSIFGDSIRQPVGSQGASVASSSESLIELDETATTPEELVDEAATTSEEFFETDSSVAEGESDREQAIVTEEGSASTTMNTISSVTPVSPSSDPLELDITTSTASNTATTTNYVLVPKLADHTDPEEFDVTELQQKLVEVFIAEEEEDCLSPEARELYANPGVCLRELREVSNF